MDKHSLSSSSKVKHDVSEPTGAEKHPLLSGSYIPPAPKQGQSTQVQPTGRHQSERIWTTVLFVTIASIPALLVGCTLGFPSIALLDLTELEEREDYKFNTLLSDIFGVILMSAAACVYRFSWSIHDLLGDLLSIILSIHSRAGMRACTTC